MKKKPKLKVEFVRDETVNFTEFTEEVLELINKNKIPKKDENKKVKNYGKYGE